MANDDKALRELARAYSSVAFRRGDAVVVWASSCDAPVRRPIIDRAQQTHLLYKLMAAHFKETMGAIAVGRSTCRGYKDAITHTAGRFGRGDRTVKTAITAPSSATE